MGMNFDFAGWATKNDILCADGRTIRDGAFRENDGQTVPLVYQHQHNDPKNILGHALLEYRPGEGMYCYAKCNDSENGQLVRQAVEHKDLTAFSIYANNLTQHGGDVVHGRIREVSVVLAGANDGAVIEYPTLAHSGEMVYDEAIIYAAPDGLELSHADEKKEDEKEVEDEKKEKKESSEEKDEDMTAAKAKEIFNSLDEDEKNAVYFIVGAAVENAGTEVKHSDESEDTTLTVNVFDQAGETQKNVLSHADAASILETARRNKVGSLREMISDRFSDNDALMHAIDTTGMDGPSATTASQTYGFRDPDMLFPEYRSLNNPPEWIKRDTDWVARVMSGVKHSPFSRIKSQYANITEDEARAKGYIKGKQKKDEVFTLLKRTTDPQTVYKRQKMDRDDINDIIDFDVVAWIKSEMRLMLDEEIARAILIGDGRNPSSDDKIKEDHIRPIVNDAPLFNTKVLVNSAHGADGSDKAEAAIEAIIRARKNYKGSGNPTFFTTEDWLTEMLLLKDDIGHYMYGSAAELATRLRVRDIVTVEVMENQTVASGASGSDELPLIGVIVNLADYNVGADKGGAVSLFDDFDIDYNQYKYLIETRISGALIKPFSALTILDNEASA